MIHKLGFNLYKSTYTLAVALLIAGSVFAQNPPPVQVYYVPFPEDQVLASLISIAVKNTNAQY